jgi:hypothetical protein
LFIEAQWPWPTTYERASKNNKIIIHQWPQPRQIKQKSGKPVWLGRRAFERGQRFRVLAVAEAANRTAWATSS